MTSPEDLILIDNRIGSKDLAPYIRHSKLVTLPFGDACFNGYGPDGTQWAIGIERKRIYDLLTSMETGRLSGHQLVGMNKRYDIMYLVIEDIWRVNNFDVMEVPRRGGWVPLKIGNRTYTGREMCNYVFGSLAALCGVIPVQTSSAAHTARVLIWLQAYWQKKKHTSHLRFQVGHDQVRLVEPTTLTKMLMGVPGVGFDRAGRIGDAYENMHQVCHASVKELREIDGVGKKGAEKLRLEIGAE